MRPSLAHLATLLLLLGTSASAACSSDSGAPRYNGGLGSSTGGKIFADDGRSGGMGGGDRPVELGGASGDGDGGAAGNGGSGSPFDNLGGAQSGPDDSGDVPPICAKNATWELESALVDLNSAADEQLVAVAPDERALVFLRDGSPFLSERSDSASPWGTPAELEFPENYDPTQGLALSADALSLIAVKTEGAGFGLFSRSARDVAFDAAANEAPFSVVNYLSQMTNMLLSRPFLSAKSELWWVETWEDTSIYMSRFEPDQPITRSHFGCTKLGACDLLLDGIDGVEKHLTGISSDHRTVLLEDELEGSLMLWRESIEEGYGFLTSVSLGDRRAPQVNDDCTRLYYWENGDLFTDRATFP